VESGEFVFCMSISKSKRQNGTSTRCNGLEEREPQRDELEGKENKHIKSCKMGPHTKMGGKG